MADVLGRGSAIGSHDDVELSGPRVTSVHAEEAAAGQALGGPQPTNSHRLPILIAAASFLVTFTGCGLNFAFGVFSRHYQEDLAAEDGPFKNASPAEIDLIGTLGASLMTIGAPFASAWARRYNPRTVTMVGGLIFGLGNVLASFGQQLWHFIVAQGLILGIGTCLSYIPAVTVAPGHFDKRRGLAMGIILSGTGVGGVFWAPLLRLAISKMGFRHTLQMTGAIGAVVVTIAGSIMKWDEETERRNRLELQSRSSGRAPISIPLVNWRLVRSRKFVAHALGACFQAAAYYTPVYFFSSYSRTLGYTAAAGANFIAASNASSAGGKVVLGYMADRLGRLNMLFACTLISTITALGLWLPSTIIGPEAEGKALFVAFAITYGIFAGAYVSLFPTSLVELFGVQNFASVNGFLYMIRGCGTLLGTPLAGTLIRSGKDMTGNMLPSALGYKQSSALVGGLLAFATAAVLWVRLEAAEWRQLKV